MVHRQKVRNNSCAVPRALQLRIHRAHIIRRDLEQLCLVGHRRPAMQHGQRADARLAHRLRQVPEHPLERRDVR